MSFLDEGTFVGKGAVKDALKDPEFKALKGDEKAKALQTLKMGGSITTEIEEANAFLAAADAARDKGDKEFEFPKGSGKMHKVTLKRDLDLEEGKLANALGGVALLAGLLLMNKINSNDPVVQRLQAEYEQADPAQQDSIKKLMTKRLIFLDSGQFDDTTPMDESFFEKPRGQRGRFKGKGFDSQVPYTPMDYQKGDPGSVKKDLEDFGKRAAKVASKRFDRGFAKFVGAEYETPFSDLVKDLERAFDENPNNNDLQKFAKEISNIEGMSQSKFNAFIKELAKIGYSRSDIEDMKKRYKKAQQNKKRSKPKATNEVKTCGCGQTPCKTYGKMKEDKQIKVDADQKFVIDLKHLMQKHGKEDTIKITKKLMKQLHDKGEVNIDGTKLMFKEADTQLALPEPPEQTANFLGPDNMDYEGGMAKSQMLKMKNYAKALCDMIDDETQLESWVQAKLTKASDYISSVYHYLDYQQTKNLNENIDPKDIDWEDIEPDIENRPDYKEGTIFGYTSDGRQVQAHGSYSEFDGYQVIDDIELV